MLKIDPRAQEQIDGLRAVDFHRPTLDRAVVERSMMQHIAALGLPDRPVVWCDDAASGWRHVIGKADSAARAAAWAAARDAARAAARACSELNALAAFDHPTQHKLVGIWLPMIDAFKAGLFLYWITPTEIVCVPSPSLSVRNNRLHRVDGPAVEWPGGEKYYFFDGLQIPADFVEKKHEITVKRIKGESNAELRRVLRDLYGRDRFIVDIGAKAVHQDEHGILWRADDGGDEPLMFVEVENATVENGERRKFHLRVPPTIKTAHQAVAWTFYMTPEQYTLEKAA